MYMYVFATLPPPRHNGKMIAWHPMQLSYILMMPLSKLPHLRV